MTTRDKVRTQIVNRLIPKYIAALDWAFLVASVQGATQSDRDEVVQLLKQNNFRGTGRKLKSLVSKRAKTLAESEADAILADDTLDLTEIVRIYG